MEGQKQDNDLFILFLQGKFRIPQPNPNLFLPPHLSHLQHPSLLLHLVPYSPCFCLEFIDPSHQFLSHLQCVSFPAQPSFCTFHI
ncbi:hypothetical protein DY000_02054736 [Brassica cretica]|uniref:Uncharacterized protein n=1 Tax=Brassica cretica TaxID=69181 RepID=A0ABQ7AL06_BRACR|nr:hypothetical protein DY000_02054736 [Brassica cretica]